MDIDFAVDGRERVINYVSEKYGRDRVAQIITFGTMAARAAVRDAGRVLEVPYGVVDKIAKLIPEGPGQTLADCLKPGSELKTAYDSDPVAKEIVDLAQPLEGLVRQDSIHAAGVVIGAGPLIDVVPLQQKGPGPGDRHAVLDEERRGARPAEDRLPRPAEPRRDRQGGRPDRRRPRHHGDPARRPEDVRDAREGRLERRLPVRVVGDARRAPRRQADRVRGPDRARRALPAGADGLHPRLRGAQERPRAGHLHRRAAEADHGRLVRDLHLPGAVHADREAARRLRAVRGRDAPPRDRQEDPLADGLPEGQVPAGLRRERRHARGREPALEGHGAVAGLLVQQGARGLLRADRLPHRLAEGEPSVRVHGRAHLVRDEHEGPRAALRERVPRDGDRGAAARREHVADRLRGRRGQDPLRPERGEERRRGVRAGDRRRARGERAVRVRLGLRLPRRLAADEQARARGADQVRRPRRARRHAHGDARGVDARADRAVRPARPGRPDRGAGLDLRRDALGSAGRARSSRRRARATIRRSPRWSSTSPSC